MRVLRERVPTHPAHDDFVFTTPARAPLDQANFYRREWVPMLRRLRIRPRPFYNTRHTYISYMLAIGARPLWVARQTGTSLKMIEEHYGEARVSAGELDALISDARTPETRNLPGTPITNAEDDVLDDKKTVRIRLVQPERATGVEPATSSLGSWHSTAELRPRGASDSELAGR